jgi:hypothetical protein
MLSGPDRLNARYRSRDYVETLTPSGSTLSPMAAATAFSMLHRSRAAENREVFRLIISLLLT